jgi:uncharacterized damage-inducible protein DinB
MLYSIYDHLDYTRWANTRFVDTLRKVDDNLFYEELKSSFSSIAKTLLHMADADTVWLRRMEGEIPTQWPSANFKGSTEDILDGVIKSSEKLVNFIKSKPEHFLRQEFTYRTMKGDVFTDTIESIIYHIVNHGTYHRGQLTTMMRELDITPLVGTDIILYLRSLKK